MALGKRDRFSFRWSKSELPDNDDINTQVLLLGITRFETTPSPAPSKLLLASESTALQPKRQLHVSNDSESIVSTDTENSESIEKLNKTTGCFPLERNKAKKSNTITSADANLVTHNNRLVSKKSHGNHFDRFIERFQSKRYRENYNQTRRNSIEQKAFYRWLHLNRNKRLERSVKCLHDADQPRQSLHTPVIRKCSTKSNSIRRKTTKKPKNPTAAAAAAAASSSTSRFSSCIPYCVAASRNDSIAGYSLASNHRYIEYGKNCGGASSSSDQHRHRLPTSNDCLMHSHFKTNKHCSPSNKNTDNNHNNNCSLFNNLNIMDRSVDSIGSCSLDVDAESTDFSDTSGSLNVCTPSSGKDFTREFTSRIHERCQFPNQQKHQQTKTVLDPNSGKISTILSQNTTVTANSPNSPVKKPSYLNLACCVNGYSNLTTYDSKFRQSINKSREVSPIRPITYAVQYNRNGDNNYLSVPTSVPINDNNKHFVMDAQTLVTPEKRYFSTQTQQKTSEMNGTNHDITDNVNSNGCAKYFTRSMLHTTTSTATSTNGTANSSYAMVRDVNQEIDANGKGTAKSFIQQRVERLYGPTAVTQGLYSPKKPKSTDNPEQTTTRTTISTVLVEKSQNSTNTTFQSTKYVLEAQRNGHLNGLSNARSAHDNDDDENINMDSLNEALPVLRHLRPEFRAQLPTLSPKRTIAITKLSTTTTSAVSPPASSAPIQTTPYTNGTAVNGKLNISTNILNTANKQTTNGGVVSPTICEQSNRSTLDMQSHKHLSSALNASDDTTKNGCITSNKSHDIEIDSRQKPIDSPTNTSCNTILTQIDTQNTTMETPSNDKQDINKLENSAEMNKNCLVESAQSVVNIGPAKKPLGESNGDGMDVADRAEPTKLITNISSAELMAANGNQNDQKKDALAYLKIVQSERDRLINLAIAAEKELDELLLKGDVDEEVLGQLRSAAGKSRLLATKKFKQFEGLCNDSINQITRDMPPPTPDDLQGFWEMVYLQVENVESLFDELDAIRANGWKKPAPYELEQMSRPVKRPLLASPATSAKKKAAALAAAQKREALRKQLAEIKRRNKLAMTAAASQITP